MNNFRQQNNSQVRINHFRPRFIFQRLGKNPVQRVLFSLRRPPIFLECRQARRMRQQMPHRHAMPPLRLRSRRNPFRQIPFHFRIQIQRHRKIAFKQFFRNRRRPNDFRQRRDVIHRVHIHRRRFRVIRKFPKRMHRNFSFISDRQRRARKRFVFHRRLNHVKRRLQLRLASHIHRRQLHRLGRHLNSKSRFQTNPRNRYRQMAANRNLSEQRARHRNLRHVADSKRADPCFRLRKSFNQVRTA